MKSEVQAHPRAFRGLPAFLWTEVLVQIHEELAMATSMMVQAVLLVFVWVLNPGLIGVALVGAVLFSMFGMGQRVLNEAAYIRIDHKVSDLYLASPLSAEAYFLGMSAGVLLVYLPPVVVVGVLAAVVIHLSVLEIGLLMLLAGTVWLTSASIGTSSRPRSATTGRSGPTRAFSSTSSECFRRCSIRSACSRDTSGRSRC